MDKNHFQKYFGYESLMPTLLFLIGIYIIFLFANQKFNQGTFVMLLGFIFYIGNNIILRYIENHNEFNDFIENIAMLTTFGITNIIYGLYLYKNDLILLIVIFFYSTCLLLSITRNYILEFKNSIGWPIPLNGLFFPLIYYTYTFYLKDNGKSIFVFYYLIIGVLMISHINFLGKNELLIQEPEKTTSNNTSNEESEENNQKEPKESNTTNLINN